MNGKQLKNSILQMAIQGKLVPQEHYDEPASVLLEKIRAEKARLVKEKKIKADKKESQIFRTADGSWYEQVGKNDAVCIDDQIPFEIPDNWSWERWGNISLSIQYGYNAPATPTGDIKMVRISDIQENQVIWPNVPFCSIPEKDIDTYLLKPNDILFARTGGTVGKSFLVREVPEPSIYAGYLIRTRYSNSLNPEYMKFFMESELYWSQLRNGTTATAQPNCNGQTLSKMLIPLPPLPEQHRIVSKLKSLMPLIESYGKSQEALDKLNAALPEKLRQSILQEAIQGRLVPQDSAEEPASVLLDKIRAEKTRLINEKKVKADKNESVIFRGDDGSWYEKEGKKDAICIDDQIPFDIPKNWQWCRFSSLVNYELGATPERGNSNYWLSGKHPWVSISDMKSHQTINSTKECVSDSAFEKYFGNKYTPKDTLIMSFKLTVGRVSLLGIDAVHNEAIISIYPFFDENNYFRDFLFHFLGVITEYTQTTDAIKGKTLNSKKMSSMFVPLPPLSEQHRIVAKIEEILPKLKINS